MVTIDSLRSLRFNLSGCNGVRRIRLPGPAGTRNSFKPTSRRINCLPYRELGDNSPPCMPVRKTARPRCWIVSSMKRKGLVHPVRAFDVRVADGHLAKETAGLVAAAMNGIRSIREECARRASTSGLPRNVCPAPAGRRIPTGMRIKLGIGNTNAAWDN